MPFFSRFHCQAVPRFSTSRPAAAGGAPAPAAGPKLLGAGQQPPRHERRPDQPAGGTGGEGARGGLTFP